MKLIQDPHYKMSYPNSQILIENEYKYMSDSRALINAYRSTRCLLKHQYCILNKKFDDQKIIFYDLN